ncbi:hypothetical protein BBJ28_00002131 [Nothophytophthora sp. Chile5]|nr:hypothetical protein BBJ28_00002131 [Nothophytophthora sp. Chile5]
MVLGTSNVSELWLSPKTIAAACVVMILGYLAVPSAQERAVRYLPKPSGYLPILRNTVTVMRANWSGRFHDWILDHCRKWPGKPWCLHLLRKEPMVVVCCPEAFEDIQKTQFDAFDKSPFVSEAMYDVLGQGIFVIGGPLWFHQRKTASHLFTSQMIQHSMDVVVADKCTALVKRLDAVSHEECSADRVVNLRRLLDLYTLDIFAKVGFGVDLHGVESNNNVGLLDAFERAPVRIMERIQQPPWLWKLQRWLNVGPERQLAEDMKLTNDLVYGVISRSIEEKSNRRADAPTADDGGREDLISLFIEKSDVEYTQGTHTTKDLKLMRDFVISFLAAGRETTAQTVAWVILMMNRYPKVLERVRQEIKDNLPDVASGKQCTPTMEEIQHLVYLEATVRETLRLFPVVAIGERMATRDVTLYDGTFIKAGTIMLMPHYAMGRMATVWGDDAEEFKPERCIDEVTGKLKVVSPFKFSAFLGGPRICLGKTFALAEVKITLAALLSQFDLKTVKDPFDFTYRSSVTLQIKGPLDVVVTRKET